MKTLFLYIVLSLNCLNGFGQFIFSVNAGYGSYNMGDMKSLQAQIASSYPVSPQLNPSFPSYWFYELDTRWLFQRKFFFGVNLATGSTGGRVYYSDYSGDIGSDQLLSFKTFQFTFGFQKQVLDKYLTVEGDVKPGITFTNLTLNSYNSFDLSSKTTSEFRSQNLTLQPTIGLSSRIGFFGIHGFAAYNLTVAAGALHAASNANSLKLNSNEDAHADWSGLRVGGGVSFYINDAQKIKDDDDPTPWTTAFGLGVGFDYGGFGMNVLTYPRDYVGIFGSLGYALAGVGYNAGFKIRTKPITSSELNVFFIGMYGYNAAIAVTDKNNFSKIFYGPTIGTGIDFGRGTHGNWSLALLIPIRSDDVDQYMNQLRANGFNITSPLIPIAISAGYHFQKRN